MPLPGVPTRWCLMRRSFIPQLLLPPLLLPVLLAAQGPPNPNPNELVRQVVAHELQAEDQDHSQWMYKDVVNRPAPAKTQIVIETTGGEFDHVEQIDGRPLTPDEKAKEDKQQESFLADPGQQRRARRAAEADDKKTRDLFSMLPDAFLFKFAELSGDTEKLTFTPNPAFHPHSMDESVFHKMDGFVIVNTKQNRLVEIAGTLTHGVQFAGGLLGHLDQGGTFDVQRREVGPSHWAVTKLKVNMNGKALFFKTINVQQDEIHSDFRPVPAGTTLAQAENLLHKQMAEKSSE